MGRDRKGEEGRTREREGGNDDEEVSSPVLLALVPP
jgi:hypothetical protein